MAMILIIPCTGSPDVSFSFIASTPTLSPFSFIQIFSNMRSYMNLAALVLAASTVSPALSAPTQYRYGNLLVEFKGRAFLISGIPPGTLGWIPIPILLSMSFVVVVLEITEFHLGQFLGY